MIVDVITIGVSVAVESCARMEACARSTARVIAKGNLQRRRRPVERDDI